MAPESSYLGVLQLGALTAVSIPGEMTSALGLEVKAALRAAGTAQPIIVGLGNEWISYMLSSEEFYGGGYEPGVSFYGDPFGPDGGRASDRCRPRHPAASDGGTSPVEPSCIGTA
jgi:hypothetical protein